MKRLALVALLALGSCATVDADAVCLSGGSQPGTDAYVKCRTALAEESAARNRLLLSRVAAVGATMATGTASQPGQSMRPIEPIRTTCHKRSEYTSGFNKICNYDCLGSAHAETISASRLCPLTVRR